VAELLKDESDRLVNNRSIIFPELPTYWDYFWIGLLAIFVISVLPGLGYFVSRSFPFHWQPVDGDPVHVNTDLDSDNGANVQALHLFESAGYGIVTPLSQPMPSYFILHIGFAFLASAQLLILFTTGRVVRWKLTSGTIEYDSAEDLHRLLALWSSICWLIVIITGAMTIPILHPTLQVANYAELCGVAAMFVGSIVSASTRQWVVHRLCAWGLIYSATASVFVGVSGRALQKFTAIPVFNIKAIGYTVAFMVPIIGLVRDIVIEIQKALNGQQNEELIQSLADRRHQLVSEKSRRFANELKPLQASRSVNLRRLSYIQKYDMVRNSLFMQEAEDSYKKRRSVRNPVGMQPTPSTRQMYRDLIDSDDDDSDVNGDGDELEVHLKSK
jgi:hypothetical protein